MTIREYIQNETKDAKTQVDLDRIWAQGFPQKVRAAFPETSVSEIMYEWDNVKMSIGRDV